MSERGPLLFEDSAASFVPGPWQPPTRDGSRVPLLAPPTPLLDTFSAEEVREAENDLKLMSLFWTLISDSTATFRYVRCLGAGSSSPSYPYCYTNHYLTDRNAMFGSYQAYRDYLAIAVAELDTPKAGTKTPVYELRNSVEPNVATRKNSPRWPEAQNVFYAWTRKACQNALGITDPRAGNIPGIVLMGKSQELKDALANAVSIYKHPIQGGGNNFRPKKKDEFGIRLGSISEHGFGRAIDIDAPHNPQFERNDWLAMVNYTGITLSEAERKSWWTSRPKDLYDKIKEASDTFAKKVADGKEKVPGALSKYEKGHKNGFLSLPWDMVKALHDAGLKWGAGFETNIDLHHFEVVPAKKKTP